MSEVHAEILESSTPNGSQAEFLRDLDHEIKTLFAAGPLETFEDGVESEFAQALLALVIKYGDTALDLILANITSERVDAEVASEALLWLGLVDHPQTYDARLKLLQQALSAPVPRVRDSAAVGLASLDDPGIIPTLQEAIGREPSKIVRQNMEQVLAQLEQTQQCLVLSEK